MPDVHTTRRNLSAVIRQVDPNFDRDQKKEVVYEFGSGTNQRKFTEDPSTSGVYDGEE